VRVAILIAFLLVFAAGLGIGAHVIARDSAAPPPTHAPGTANREERTRQTTAKNAATAEAERPRIQVTAPVDHRGREGIEEAEVDSHENASGAGG
jgi:hypothetical protein